MPLGSPARRARLSLAAAVLVGVALFQLSPPARAVIGGQAAAEGADPFMASLQRANGSSFCGGTVVTPDWVLTAAHCVADSKTWDNLFVVTGRTDLDDVSRGQRIKVVRVDIHPKYADATHDVALLRLQTPTQAPPVRLATAADEALEAPGTSVRVAGWGDTLPTLGLFSSNQLREVDLSVISDSECGQTNIGFDAATGVCAEALLKDSCNGDSGGPLFTTRGTPIQIGIVSYGTSCAVPAFPGVYSEINNPAIRSWITATAGV